MCVPIVINGSGGSGKDTFVTLCAAKTKYKVQNISTVDPIKQAAKILGWTGRKEEVDRKFLSDLKDLSTEYSDCPFNYIKNIIETTDADFVFIHCREPQEIQKFVDKLNAITVFIDASNRIKAILTNHADKDVNNYEYDFYIDNNLDLNHLGDEAIYFVKVLEELKK